MAANAAAAVCMEDEHASLLGGVQHAAERSDVPAAVQGQGSVHAPAVIVGQAAEASSDPDRPSSDAHAAVPSASESSSDEQRRNSSPGTGTSCAPATATHATAPAAAGSAAEFVKLVLERALSAEVPPSGTGAATPASSSTNTRSGVSLSASGSATTPTPVRTPPQRHADGSSAAAQADSVSRAEDTASGINGDESRKGYAASPDGDDDDTLPLIHAYARAAASDQPNSGSPSPKQGHMVDGRPGGHAMGSACDPDGGDAEQGAAATPGKSFWQRPHVRDTVRVASYASVCGTLAGVMGSMTGGRTCTCTRTPLCLRLLDHAKPGHGHSAPSPACVGCMQRCEHVPVQHGPNPSTKNGPHGAVHGVIHGWVRGPKGLTQCVGLLCIEPVPAASACRHGRPARHVDVRQAAGAQGHRARHQRDHQCAAGAVVAGCSAVWSRSLPDCCALHCMACRRGACAHRHM